MKEERKGGKEDRGYFLYQQLFFVYICVMVAEEEWASWLFHGPGW